MSALEFWFEFGSTYSYPAAMRIEEVARSRGVTVHWNAFLLGPIFKAQGWSDSPFNLYPEKGRYMWRDLERICSAQQIPLKHPSQFPRNGLLAARIACQHQRASWVPAFVRAVYRANFADDADIADASVIAACLDAAGQQAAPLLEQAASPESKAALRSATDAAVSRGIFGAPSFVAGDELFWGNDRLEEALAWRTSTP